jgi:hypothetical protein
MSIVDSKLVCHCGRRKTRNATQCADCRFGVENIESETTFWPTTPRELLEAVVSQCKGQIS